MHLRCWEHEEGQVQEIRVTTSFNVLITLSKRILNLRPLRCLLVRSSMRDFANHWQKPCW